ncbi:phospholipase C [Antrihabitans cavernicola]|uniref:phospholipase C n=1 Tax=Antrihabitans cavernicola TaxID=2495913 RepID=UPI002096CC97|nr:alkaline phosphatase family protein [Spelaeibacter cavernicola]
MDKFIESTTKDKCASAGANMYETAGETMGYYDGNTVTGLWNYAQNYALNDNSFGSVFGPSTPGALDLISGQTHGVRSYDPVSLAPTATPDESFVESPSPEGVGTVIEDPDPLYDDCSNGNDRSAKSNLAGMEGQNIGDLLNKKDISWGWFQGGFRPSAAWDGQDGHYATCKTGHKTVAGGKQDDYSPHHQPFQYYKSTANPHHLAPATPEEIGHNGQANHQYDLTDFDTALSRNALPAVTFLKAPKYQDGHAANSDPIDEQQFVTHEVNQLQQSDSWKDTAVVLAYDDSDGWYDHVAAKLLNGSSDPKQDTPMCSDLAAATPPVGGYQDRCGPGTRQPLLVVSPYAKKNFVDHTATEQTSILKFIEDNWSVGRIGDASFDERAGSMNAMFDFGKPRTDKVFLNEANGSVAADAASAKTPPQQSSVNPSASASSDTSNDDGTNVWKIVIPIVIVVALLALGAYAYFRSRRPQAR